ncbi:efflux RND transporter permease subunit [Xanthomonas perforans]|uniref:Efflux pump membrane transporter n=2 Tax=Xanthomonas euvesicatoria TaxID=456327 RepID=Q3BYU5_XANE5|nr:efflux RND transporter permease subunit [Xanthomonas euvesicatoria]MBZ2618223.1 efflux RND transporter permease subunit [Xanthomonas perforans]AOY68024.1 multidrug efflux RND transporter permease [Xanthomonas euvesicatoria pv. vesicatoria str. 85-10]APO92195.1 multidrug efflux RND transporter permease [Xanthomonas euvesicatoria]KLB44528.1 multidrug transporter [Xanthomonas euvesicatoria]MCC8515857.1 efflux RND transporter permease subunit [Xanthomonas euvesicatoria pv. euvesicatoria]
MARFFIDRPIFAWVIAIVITLAGALSILSLPLEQYPNIAPPTINVSATYTGASAQTVQNSVTQILEQQMTGLDHLLYMSSSSSSAGTASITLTFDSGTDPDTAQVQVQNKVSQGESMLPEAVQSNGVTVTKSTGSSMFMVLAFTSEDGSMDSTDIGDYMVSTLQDPISRLNGVGGVNVFGSEYSMRVWLDPDKLRTYALMPADVSNAISAQNADVSSGALGALPAVQGQQLNATVTSRSKLKTPAQFEAIVLKSQPGGATVYLRDVARVELGSKSYASSSKYNGKSASGMGLELATGANALDAAKAVEDKLEQLKPYFPTGLKYEIAYDTTPFVRISIEEVVKTLLEAIALVVLVIYLFLQNWRATLVPVIAVPVVLLGTFGVLALLGYSINTLTMFAMVLAIGLLVDDAIVVVENVERLMSEQGMSPRQATHTSMGQISGALVGIALVLTAVFLPMAFFGGATGEIYRQFSVTIAAAMLLSLLVALTLSPALCASLLKPIARGGHVSRQGMLGRFFGRFNARFDRSAEGYGRGVGTLIGHRKLGGLVYLALLVVMALLFWRLPSSFLPDEDQGMLMVMFTTPAGATQQRTQQSIDQATDFILKQPEVAGMMTISGFSFAGSSQNSGMGFIKLKDWAQRDAPAQEIANRITGAMMGALPDAQVFALSPPAINGLGTSSGFTLQLQDVAGKGHDALVTARQQLLQLANADKAGALGLDAADINTTLATVMGGSYVNDFLNNNRVKRVYVQGEPSARMLPADIGRWYVRNSSSEMVPFSAFSSSAWAYAPQVLSRFNGVESMEITGSAASGISSGEAMNGIAGLVGKIGKDVGYAWSGMSYQEQAAGAQTWMLYAVSLVFVFLCLAALYESWSIPISVMLAVPVGIVGALLATWLRGLSNDIYFQVGLLATMGLAAKNGILIVEFAKELEEKGQPLIEATLHAARMRLRPIVMTSLAFLLGVLPMVVSSGAGSGGRHSLGTGVLGGTLVSTLLGIFFVPLFYVMVRSVFPDKASDHATAAETSEVAP